MVEIIRREDVRPPWAGIAHTFGTELKGASSEEAIKAAGLDWTVEKRPIYLEGTDGQALEIPNKKALVRTDTLDTLSIVTNKYEPHQNIDSFRWMDKLVSDGLMTYEVAGRVGKGQKIWMLGKIGSSEVIKDELMNQYLLLVNPHDGNSWRALFTSVRAICCNMIAWAMREKIGDMFSFRHTGNIEAKLEEAQVIMSAAKEKFAAYDHFIQMTNRIQMDSAKMTDFVKYLFPEPKDIEKHKKTEARRETKRQDIIQLFENGIGQDNPAIRGTGWAAYNAVTEYVNHHRPVRNKEMAAERRFNNVAFGQNVLVQKATQFLLEAA